MNPREGLIEAMCAVFLRGKQVNNHTRESMAMAFAAIESHGGGCRVVPVTATPAILSAMNMTDYQLGAGNQAAADWAAGVAASIYAPEKAP